MVAMMYEARSGSSSRDGHLQGIVCEGGVDPGPHRPSDHHPRPYADDDGDVEPALAGLGVSDVGEPRPVGAIRLEVAFGQVFRITCLGPALGGRGLPEADAARAGHAALRHQPRNALLGRAYAALAQLEHHLGRPVAAVELLPEGYHRAADLEVPLVVGRDRARLPLVVSLAGHLEDPAHRRHAPPALVGVYELELRLLHIDLVAKKALAFKSISFSSLRRAFSRLSWRISSCIWKGLPSLEPSAFWAC